MKSSQPAILLAMLMVCVLPGCGGGGGSDVEYVAMGASDAVGIGADPISKGYTHLIERDLDDCGTSTNLDTVAVPGVKMGEVEEIQVPEARLLDPDLITLWPGLNDLKDGDSGQTFESHLNSILSDLTSKTSAFIVLANIPDLTQLTAFQGNHNVTRSSIAEYNAIIARQAAQFNVPVADLSGASLSDNLIVDEHGPHPNNAGHQVVANAFIAVIHPHFCH